MATRNIQKRTGPSGRVVAIDVGINAVRVVEVEFAGESPRLSKRGTAPLNPIYWEDLVAGRDALTQAIRSALSSAGITAIHAVAALPRRLVTLKNARLPHADPEQISGMVPFEAQNYVPFPLEEVVLDHQIVSDETDEMATVLIVAARRIMVEAFLSAFDKAGIEVTRLSVSALALSEHGGGSTVPVALLDVESGEMELAVVSGGRPLFTRAASLGVDASGEADTARLSAEVVRSLAAYQNEFRSSQLTKILLAGSPGTITGLEATLSGLVEIPIARVGGPMFPSADPDALSYATAAGLALEEGGGGVSHISLIPSSRLERKIAAKRKTNAALAAAAFIAVVAVGIFYMTKMFSAQAAENAAAAKANQKLGIVNTALTDRKAKHDKLVKTYQILSGGLGRNIATVDLVKAVSDSVPKGSGIYLTQLNFDRSGTLAIHGNAKTESAATDLVISLQGAGPFTQARLNYLGDAMAENGVGKLAGDKQAKPGENMSFLVMCRIPVPVIDKAKTTKTNTAIAQNGTPAVEGAQP